MSSLIRNPLVLALDVDTKEEAFQFISQVGDLVGCIKIGPRLVNRYGESLIAELAKIAPVFVDHKFFDIPSTMESAIRNVFSAGATLATIHALSGHEAMTQFAKVERELNQVRPFKILAVTILTSWTESSLPKNLKEWGLDQHVRSLAEEVKACGLSGVVCSGHELSLLKDLPFFKLTPGIRLSDSASSASTLGSSLTPAASSPVLASINDQKRVMTPSEAIKAGATALVIGRPILQSKSPRDTVQQILQSIQS